MTKKNNRGSANTGRRPAHGKSLIIVGVVLLVILVTVFLVIRLSTQGALEAFDPSNTEMYTVVVESGSSTTAIAEKLEAEGIIGSAGKFKMQCKAKGYDGKLQAGTYELSPSMDFETLARTLTTGAAASNRFTIPEGYTVKETGKKLAAEGLVDYEVFMAEVAHGTFDYWFLEGAPAGENRLEGYLYPETYDVFLDASEHDIIERMLSQFDKMFTEEMAARAEDMGYDVNQIITIASIIEGEARADEERPQVASVIYNRLEIDMALGMDCTIQFLLDEPREFLRKSDLKIDSPYNTYLYKGLPPGPVCSPSKSSMDAALAPAETDYLYYVLKGDGTYYHNFAEDYEQFLKYKKEYQDYYGL